MPISSHRAGKPYQPAYRRVTEDLRERIAGGEITPGTKLPSINELAATWKLGYCTINTAMTTLAREGWVERRHGSGTYAVDPKSRFVTAGIYREVGFTLNNDLLFARNLHFALISEFERLKKTPLIFTDPRPEAEQGKILPELAEALLHRRIQCLVALSLNGFNRGPLARLSVPTAFMSNVDSLNNCNYDVRTLLRDGTRRLAREGCRSVGLISNYSGFGDIVRQTAAEEGLATRESWICTPSYHVTDLESYGFNEFRKFWKQETKPDGLLVFPDLSARGVITAVLDIGKSVVLPTLKFIFHRNVHVNLLCPFPVTWAISDEEILAKGLVELIEKQFRGEKITPVLLPYIYKQGTGEMASDLS